MPLGVTVPDMEKILQRHRQPFPNENPLQRFAASSTRDDALRDY